MSASQLSKTHIDAIVTAAVKWGGESGFVYYWHDPRGPEHQWVVPRRVSRANADDVGATLCRANILAAVRGNRGAMFGVLRGMPEYSFDELPGDPNALVVLNLIASYGYQTADDPVAWYGSEHEAFLSRLRNTAVSLLPGVEHLPWKLSDQDRDVFLRWGAADADAVLAELRGPSEDERDPLLEAIDARLRASGLPFVDSEHKHLHETRSVTGFAEGDELGYWTARPPNAPHTPAISVRLLRTEELARKLYDQLLLDARRRGLVDSANVIIRVGRVVAQFAQRGLTPTSEGWDHVLDDVFQGVDQRWSASESVQPCSDEVDVLADRVQLTAHAYEAMKPPGGVALVARTPKSLARLCDLIENDDLKQKLAATDTTKHTVILLTNVATVDPTGAAELIHYASIDGEKRDPDHLFLGTNGWRLKCGTVLRTDRLVKQPDAIHLRHPLGGSSGNGIPVVYKL
jgi:hypothetical protein